MSTRFGVGPLGGNPFGEWVEFGDGSHVSHQRIAYHLKSTVHAPGKPIACRSATLTRTILPTRRRVDAWRIPVSVERPAFSRAHRHLASVTPTTRSEHLAAARGRCLWQNACHSLDCCSHRVGSEELLIWELGVAAASGLRICSKIPKRGVAESCPEVVAGAASAHLSARLLHSRQSSRKA